VTSTPEPEFAELTRLIREFTEERDWAKFHDPKSLILALVGEVGELAELFQWVAADDAAASVAEPRRRTRVGEELADVLTYLILLADGLGIDLLEAARSKLEAGRARYPAEEMRGVAPEKA
jgi:NTP pyrophosphatase (non-canonical NTP hydrolase)